MKKIGLSFKNVGTRTRVLTYTAMLTAVALLFNIFTITTGVKYFAISFTYLPAFVAGVLINPIAGFSVGFIADLLGTFIRPLGPYNPIINISAGLLGLIPGLVFHYLKLNDYIKIFIAFFLTFVICTVGMNTYALYLMYSKSGVSFWGYLILRLPWQAIVVGINMAIVMIIYKPLCKVQRIFLPTVSQTERAAAVHTHLDEASDIYDLGEQAQHDIHSGTADECDN